MITTSIQTHTHTPLIFRSFTDFKHNLRSMHSGKQFITQQLFFREREREKADLRLDNTRQLRKQPVCLPEQPWAPAHIPIGLPHWLRILKRKAAWCGPANTNTNHHSALGAMHVSWTKSAFDFDCVYARLLGLLLHSTEKQHLRPEWRGAPNKNWAV